MVSVISQSVTVSVPNVSGVVAKESSRYAIRGIRLGANGIGAATDGRCAVLFKHTPTPSTVLVDVPKYGATGAQITIEGETIKATPVSGKDRRGMPKLGGGFIAETVEGTFPPCGDLVNPEDDRIWVGLNPDPLMGIAKALKSGDSPTLLLGFSKDSDGNLHPGKPILCMNVENRDAVGILMPVVVPKDAPEESKALQRETFGKYAFKA